MAHDGRMTYDGEPGPDRFEATPQDAQIAQEITDFWELSRIQVGLDKLGIVVGHGVADTVPPPAWAFGDNPALADELLAAVLAGRKTATSSALPEYETTGDPVPVKGDLSILLDGSGHPRALIRTTSVETMAFDEVNEAFAFAEGEDDGSLESWRTEHRKYFSRVLGREVPDDLPVVCERFELRYPRLRQAAG